jgi:hypothetical protein
MMIRLAAVFVSSALLTSCAPSAQMERAEPRSGSGNRQGLYDCPNATGTNQVIAENQADADLLCGSPAGGR